MSDSEKLGFSPCDDQVVLILECLQAFLVKNDGMFGCLQVLDKEEQMKNPCSSWLVNTSWDNITVLEQLPGFQGIMESFEQYSEEWKLWFTSIEPEKSALPGLLWLFSLLFNSVGI